MAVETADIAAEAVEVTAEAEVTMTDTEEADTAEAVTEAAAVEEVIIVEAEVAEALLRIIAAEAEEGIIGPDPGLILPVSVNFLD